MLEPSAVETPAPTSLSEHLQQAIEALAATTDQDTVLHLVLASALVALGAVAGAVLLLGADGQRLQVAATRGREAEGPTIWQDGVLSVTVPTGAALEQHQALFFEHPGALVGAYPDFGSQAGDVAPVATAVLPMFLDQRPLGCVVIDFREPHHFTPEERRFLQTLAAQCALALGRAQLLTRLHLGEASFRRLTEVSPVGVAVGSLDGRLTLANEAWLQMLGQTRAAFEAGQIDWQALTPPEYAEAEQQAFETVLTQGRTVRYDKEMLDSAGERIPLQITLARFDERQVVGYALDLRPCQAQQRVLQQESVRLESLVQERTDALLTEQLASSAFMAFTEAASRSGTVQDLARLALAALQNLLPGSSVAFYERGGESWYARQLTADMPPELQAVLQGGLPLETPSFAEMVRTQAPVFIDHWSGAEDGVEHGSAYEKAALCPIFQGEEIGAALTLGLRGQDIWTEREQSVVLAVGRSFSLLYDRIAGAELLRSQQAEAERRSQALNAFEQLSRDLIGETNRYALVRRAQEIVLSLLPSGFAVYYELQEGLWRIRAQVGALAPELQALLDGGLPFEAPSAHSPWTTGAPYYQDTYAQGSDTPPEVSRSVKATASMVLRMQGEPVGVFSVGLVEQWHWTAVDRTVLGTALRSLELALERAYSVQQMQQQTAEAESRNRALEAFSTLTGVLDVRLDRYELIRRTQGLVLSLLPPGYAAYFEPEHGLWRLKAQTGDAGSEALQRVIEAGIPVGGTPTLDMAVTTGEPYFVDVYAQDTDIDPEVAGHLNAAACLPIYIRGQFVGIFNLPLFHTMAWNATDRAVLISAVQSLTLALEGAQSLAELAERSSELEASNGALQSANEELEAFTYSASHDLRTPVRHVMGFAELAQKALADTPNAKAQQYLDVVKQAALRMTALIDGMLLLSRSGRQELQVQPVDLNALATQARRDVAAEFAGHPVRWEIAQLPRVRGDHTLLQQVMTNLLSNAVKYSSKRELSQVRVWSEASATEWIIRVQDNGVGFAPAYAQKLFGIFQRLHTEKDFNGTGVGLATVKRIVQKHGGRVEAESEAEQGAIFSFTLPKLPL